MPENKGLRLRTLWSSSSIAQEVPLQHKHRLNPALHCDLLASKSTENCTMSKVRWKGTTTRQRVLFRIDPIRHQINKVHWFLFFIATIMKPACLWLSAKLYSTLGERYTAAYRASGRPGIHQLDCWRVTRGVHKNNYMNSTPCPFCSPENCGSWG